LAKAGTAGKPISLAMPCWIIINPVTIRSTLKARGAHAASFSIMYVPPKVECA
jgi:hypothetical protein